MNKLQFKEITISINIKLVDVKIHLQSRIIEKKMKMQSIRKSPR